MDSNHIGIAPVPDEITRPKRGAHNRAVESTGFEPAWTEVRQSVSPMPQPIGLTSSFVDVGFEPTTPEIPSRCSSPELIEQW